MKLLFKLLTLSFLITAPILGMDGQDAERKQTQAELEQQRQQVENQQKIQLQNIRDSHAQSALRDLLPSTTQKLILEYADESTLSSTDKLITKMKTRLPNQVFRMIGRFIPDYKIVHQNMEKLLPVVIRWEDRNLFDRISDPSIIEEIIDGGLFIPENFRLNAIDLGPQSQYRTMIKNCDSYIAHKFKNGQILYTICRKKREQLEQLSIDQIQYLMTLYDVRKRKAKGRTLSLRTYFHDHDLKPTQRDLELYTALTEQIKNCLKHNYGKKMPYQMKYPTGTIVF